MKNLNYLISGVTIGNSTSEFWLLSTSFEYLSHYSSYFSPYMNKPLGFFVRFRVFGNNFLIALLRRPQRTTTYQMNDRNDSDIPAFVFAIAVLVLSFVLKHHGLIT